MSLVPHMKRIHYIRMSLLQYFYDIGTFFYGDDSVALFFSLALLFTHAKKNEKMCQFVLESVEVFNMRYLNLEALFQHCKMR